MKYENTLVGKAFAPAHVTGFFVPRIFENDPKRSGSCGAGICLSEGVLTTATLQEIKHHRRGAFAEPDEIEVYINGTPSTATTTRRAVTKVMAMARDKHLKIDEVKKSYKITIRSTVKLPARAGLGISGAGALSSALALGDALSILVGTNTHIPFEELVSAAHEAEVEERTGLGDVVAQAVGGVVVRELPGAPPFGILKKINSPTDTKIVLCTIGTELETRTVLSDSAAMNKITEYGEHCLHKLRELLNTHRFSLDEFFELSYEFALRTGLINSALEGAVEDARKYGFASMAMLGKTVFAMGDTKKLVSVLRKFGKVYTCTISTLGARAIPASFNPK